MSFETSWTRSFDVLGVRVDSVQIPDTVQLMEAWIARHDCGHYVAVTGMHGVMEARHDPCFRAILNTADLVVPDGMPLVWLGRLRGYSLPRRVYGPELMMSFFKKAASRGYKHFFYGGAPGVPDKLVRVLQREFPTLVVVGTHSPPFRLLTPDEDGEIVRTINKSEADILWVGLSTPKQERWMYEHRHRLRVPVLVGVGAAFDFHAGIKRQAPVWMGEHGLEWLYRLLQEPRRLWCRYLVYGPEFLFWVTLDLLGVWKFNNSDYSG